MKAQTLTSHIRGKLSPLRKWQEPCLLSGRIFLRICLLCEEVCRTRDCESRTGLEGTETIKYQRGHGHVPFHVGCGNEVLVLDQCPTDAVHTLKHVFGKKGGDRASQKKAITPSLCLRAVNDAHMPAFR
jgi:hypothetical protein